MPDRSPPARRRRFLAGLGLALGAWFAGPAAAQMAPSASGAALPSAHEPQMGGRAMAALPEAREGSAVTRWVLLTDRLAGGLPSPQAMAAVTMAMHDALNAVAPRHPRWLPAAADEPPSAGADPVAAMSMAAFHVLASLHPVPVMRAEAEPVLRDLLRRIPGEALHAGLAVGSAVGAAAAARIPRRPAFIPFPFGETPGRWRPTPPVPIHGSVAVIQPILFASRDALRGAPPPGLDDPRYLRDLEEVRRLGGEHATARTAEQTGIAEFWAAQSSQRGFMHLALRLLRDQPRPGGDWEEAWIVSMLGAALADSAVIAWEEKRVHAHWRPVTAINLGQQGIAPDPGWEPLLPTPPHPDYPSGHATDCAAGAAVLAAAFGAGFGPVTYIAVEPAEKPSRTYPSFEAASAECAESRVWAGAHFRFANEEGTRLGRAIAAAALARVPPLAR